MNSFFTLQLYLSSVLIISLVEKGTFTSTGDDDITRLCGINKVGKGGCLQKYGRQLDYRGCPCCAGLYSNSFRICMPMIEGVDLAKEQEKRCGAKNVGCLQLVGDNRKNQRCPCCAGLKVDQTSGKCEKIKTGK
jgi:hypothetical protein